MHQDYIYNSKDPQIVFQLVRDIPVGLVVSGRFLEVEIVAFEGRGYLVVDGELLGLATLEEALIIRDALYKGEYII